MTDKELKETLEKQLKLLEKRANEDSVLTARELCDISTVMINTVDAIRRVEWQQR